MKHILTAALLAATFNASAVSEVQCMADVIHAESRGEGEAGMAAVGYALFNRVKQDGFKHGVCWHSRHGFHRLHADFDQKAYTVAALVLAGVETNPIGNRTHFDSGKRTPAYAVAVRRIGKQRFYRAAR